MRKDDDDDEMEVVWSGRDELLPPRASRPGDTWTRPRRMYVLKPKAPPDEGECVSQPSVPEESQATQPPNLNKEIV